MKRQSFILILIGIICVTCQHLKDPTDEDLLTAVTTRSGFTLDFEIPVLVMPPVDVQALLEEDQRAMMENIQRPFRFGYAIDVDIDIKKYGANKELPDGGNLWLLKIHCPDAFSINLIYNHFRLANGSKFYVYNEDKSMVLGVFTPEESNNPYNEFATDLVQGDSVILEYYEPEFSDDGVINISKVIHGYKNTFASNGLGTSADCNRDVMCLLGNDWVIERRAVAMLLVDNNTAYCSGCLVNNTAQDSRPYILTARHCIYANNGNSQTTSLTTSIFRFLYWRPNCPPPLTNPSNWVSITGATMRAHYAPTDFALLELNTRPSASWNLHYAGWDRTATPAQTATGIHHPKGDAMKISHEEHAAFAQNHPITGATLSTWRVAHFEEGTLQPGSSGSPLFNPDSRIVGQLSTAPSVNDNNAIACLSTNQNGNYGRFDMSWDRAGSASTNRLRDWLDPLGTAPATLNGIGGPFISGPDVIGASCSATYTIGLPSTGTSNHQWQVLGGSSSGLTPYSDSGTSFTVSRTASLYDPVNATIQVSFTYNGQSYSLSKNITARILPVIAGPTSLPYGMPEEFAIKWQPTYFISNIPNIVRPYILQYQWEIITDSSGSYVLLSGEHTETPVIFDYSGTYRVSLRVRDGCGWSKWDEVYIDVY